MKFSEIILCLALCLFISGCPAAVVPLPKIDVTTWAGDSFHEGISRGQEDRTISCSDRQIDEYVCMTYVDLRKIYNTMLQCKDWGGTPVSADATEDLVRRNSDVVERVMDQP